MASSPSQYTGQPHTTKNDLARNVNSAGTEKPCYTAILLDDKVQKELSKTRGINKEVHMPKHSNHVT